MGIYRELDVLASPIKVRTTNKIEVDGGIAFWSSLENWRVG